MKLKINSKRSYKKYKNSWRFNNILLNDEWATGNIKEKTRLPTIG